MADRQAAREADVVPTLYAIACFATVTTLTLAEQVAQLPAAAVALASGWWIVGAAPRPGRGS